MDPLIDPDHHIESASIGSRPTDTLRMEGETLLQALIAPSRGKQDVPAHLADVPAEEEEAHSDASVGTGVSGIMASFDDNDTICTEALLFRCEAVTAKISAIDTSNMLAFGSSSRLLLPLSSEVGLPQSPSRRHQYRALCVLSTVLAVLSTGLLAWWNRAYLMSGLSFHEAGDDHRDLLKWHAFWMSLAFCFMTIAMLSSPSTQLNPQQPTRLGQCGHAILWILAAVCGSLGLFTILHFHKHKNNQETTSTHSSWSLHALFGAVVTVMYLGQLPVGCLLKWCNGIKRQVHIGRLAAYVTTAITILMGFQEQEDTLGCSDPEGVVAWDYKSNTKLRHTCLQSQLLGSLLFLMTLCTCFALYNGDSNQFGVTQEQSGNVEDGVDFEYQPLTSSEEEIY